MRKTSYLKHIDGLRALAVLSVLLFHFDVLGASGGFVGVDIFFVISGFLITRLITGEIEETGKFDFANFYFRRIRRLFPALILVLLASSVVVIVLFTPETLFEFGGSLAAAATSTSNIWFWNESGYFESPAQLKPLLHTWSLSVEEQFYLIWPITLFTISIFKSSIVRIGLVICIGAISFLLNYILIHSASVNYSKTIFFLAPFRVFEFTIGALGVFLIDKNFIRFRFTQELLGILGISLCILSIVTEDKHSNFPYVYALPSCIGALLIIMAENSYLIRRLLSNKLVVSIGLISYSLYLVHWPILVFAKYIFLDVSSTISILTMFGLSLLLSILLYKFVECPFRNPRSTVIKSRVHLISISLLVLIFILGLSMRFSDGWNWRNLKSDEFDSTDSEHIGEMLTIDQINQGKSRRYKDLQSACTILTLDDTRRCHMNRPVQILVFGNSHEPDGFNMLMRLYENNSSVNLINFGTTNNCDIEIGSNFFSSKTDNLDCKKRFSILGQKEFALKITHIFHNTHHGFEYFAKGMWELMRIIQQNNPDIHVISTGSYIATTMECATLKNKFGSYDACKSKDVVDYFNPNEKINSKIPETKTLQYLYINKYSLLCEKNLLDSCITHVGNIPMFYDQHHLSYEFARYLGELIGRNYRQELIDAGLPDPIKDL